ncbi:unnamed protein product [Phytophthora fragariaefolia]|uniref:Unnamed protein product n=1 Tax=Phytophthora fragariaefolia TaxID=1490495 RepID=A0A9W7CSF7_9STRA|nr:unnamed protein product [Phytophthora fragariaefolia]
MQIHRVMFLAAAIVLLGGDAAITKINTKASPHSSIAEEDHSMQKWSRNYSVRDGAADSNNEERVLGARDPDKIFMELGLGGAQMLIHNTDAGTKWFKAILKYRKAKKSLIWYPDEHIYTTLRQGHSEGQIAQFLQSLEDNGQVKDKVKTLANELQKLQFQAWFNADFR